MSKIGCREIYFTNAMQSRGVDFLIDKVKNVVKEMELPSGYDVRVYKNVYSCCGVGGLGVIIEVAGPEERTIKAIDLRAVSKIMEFCEDAGYHMGEHTVEKHDIV
jgi:hypothetical protein